MMEKILYLTAGAVIAYIYLKQKNNTQTLQTSNINPLYDGNFNEDFYRNFDNSTSNKINNYQT